MLKLENLFVKYEKQTILEGVSVDFLPGEVNVITSKSGSGKSTIIKLINEIIPQFDKTQVEGKISHNNNRYNKTKCKSEK